MSKQQVLTPEDDLFGRVLLVNGLASLSQIVECARVIAAEAVAGRERRSLASVMIAKGYLTPQKAGAVEATMRKRLAARQGAAAAAKEPSAPSPKPAPMKERAPAGDSQIMVAAGASAAPQRGGAKGDEAELPDAQLAKIVSRIAPARIYPEMLDYIIKKRVSVIDASELAQAINEPEKEVVKALKRWQRAGVLRKIGTYPFNFSPNDREEEEIRLFLSAWTDPTRHAKVLGFILAEE